MPAPTLEDLTSPRAVAAAGGLDVVDPYALADYLRPVLVAQGLRSHGDERTVPYAVKPGQAPRRLDGDSLLALLGRAAVDALRQAEALASSSSATRRARDTRHLLERSWPGSKRYLWTLRRQVVEFAPDLTEDEIAAVERANAEKRRAARRRRNESLPRPHRNTARRTEYAEAKTHDLGETSRVLTRWVATLPPGRHPLPEVWRAWQAAVGASDRYAHLADAVGRTTFYRLLAEVGDVVTGTKARARYVIVPVPIATQEEPMLDEIRAEAAVYREAADEAERLLRLREALHDHAARHGIDTTPRRVATGTDGPVVDLDAARASRR